MEKTIVQFILDNIFLFLPLGITGIVVTIILFFLPKQEAAPKYEDVKTDFITIFKFRLNIYVLVYLFIWIMMVIIGVLSNFFIPTLIGGIIATVPLVLLVILEHRTNNSKVS
jgi:hypothetical protein